MLLSTFAPVVTAVTTADLATASMVKPMAAL